MTSSIRNSEVRSHLVSWGGLLWLLAAWALGLLLTAAALWFWGAQEVRSDPSPVAGLTMVGLFWLAVASRLFPWLGLSTRDDVLERRNPAALIALACAVVAVAITFAAGNLGEGPSYSENVFCGGLATGTLMVLWLALELGAKVSNSIAEERDVATGLRFGGLLLAWGLILGRAVTGDWHSCSATVMDFLHDGWPALATWVAALMIELGARPSRMRPFPSWPVCGLVPALFYLLGAIIWLWHLGRWEGMPT